MAQDAFDLVAGPARGRMRTAPLHIADALRRAILDGTLGGGVALRQERLAEAFDTSRFPVREALRLLEAEGLVDFHPHRGAVVAEVDAVEAADVYAVRAALESMAVELSVPDLTGEDLDRATALLDELDEAAGDLTRTGELNARFHLTLMAQAGRPRLLAEVERYLGLGDRLLRFHFARADREAASQDEHRAILAAARTGDGPRAATLLRAHILGAAEKLSRLIEQGKGPR